MPSHDFPTTVAAITPEWLTRALGGPEALGGARVAEIAVEPIGAGVGFLGVINPLRLTYDRPAPGAPASVVAKLPSPDPAVRQLNVAFRWYEKEVRFYEDIARTCPLRAPRALRTGFDAASLDFVLVMEDLAPARNGDQLAGLSIADAAVAVEALARMQAAWWNAPQLHALPWLPPFDDASLLALEGVFAQCWQPYQDFLADRLPAAMRPVGERLRDKIIIAAHRLAKKTPTLVHGDYRADNFFFGPPASPFTVVDWQIVLKGPGVFDLAYLLSGNLTVENRRAAEADLVRLYHRTLVAGGVQGYDFEACWTDYRILTLFGWLWPVVAVGSLDPANARGVAFFLEWSRRVTAAVLDLDAAEAAWAFLA
jgi:hypothetical protein